MAIELPKPDIRRLFDIEEALQEEAKVSPETAIPRAFRLGHAHIGFQLLRECDASPGLSGRCSMRGAYSDKAAAIAEGLFASKDVRKCEKEALLCEIGLRGTIVIERRIRTLAKDCLLEALMKAAHIPTRILIDLVDEHWSDSNLYRNLRFVEQFIPSRSTQYTLEGLRLLIAMKMDPDTLINRLSSQDASFKMDAAVVLAYAITAARGGSGFPAFRDIGSIEHIAKKVCAKFAEHPSSLCDIYLLAEKKSRRLPGLLLSVFDPTTILSPEEQSSFIREIQERDSVLASNLIGLRPELLRASLTPECTLELPEDGGVDGRLSLSAGSEDVAIRRSEDPTEFLGGDELRAYFKAEKRYYEMIQSGVSAHGIRSHIRDEVPCQLTAGLLKANLNLQ